MSRNMSVEQIAKICHEANRTYCQTINDFTQRSFEEAAEWQRTSAIAGVHHHLDNPDSEDSDSHKAWMTDKLLAGWKYGENKDEEAKTHPCIVPFEKLPIEQQRKDALFRAIVHALAK